MDEEKARVDELEKEQAARRSQPPAVKTNDSRAITPVSKGDNKDNLQEWRAKQACIKE
jgi:hypothetical protein